MVRPTVDKHSTGGVGDKTTLVVGPLAATLGAAVPKLSGRGLAHTGGTLDKLESIPGYRIDLALDDFVATVNSVGMAVAAATADVVPADKKMYALRDVTATVPSLPLIVSSVMSKKLAIATDAIVLDVKVGEGAFFATEPEARLFGEQAVALGHSFERQVRCVLTAMDKPLGRAVGNHLEVAEAIATLRGQGPDDFTDLCVTVAAEMIVAVGIADEDTARARVAEALTDGTALATFEAWIAAQGGDLEAFAAAAPASRQIVVNAESDGVVEAVHALAVGRLAMRLGAGRETKEDVIDLAAGIVLSVAPGQRVRKGDPLAALHTNRTGDDSLWSRDLRAAIAIGNSERPPAPVVIDVIRGPRD